MPQALGQKALQHRPCTLAPSLPFSFTESLCPPAYDTTKAKSCMSAFCMICSMLVLQKDGKNCEK